MEQKGNEITKAKYQRNLRLILIETVLTSIGAGFSISTINIFWNSIGMNQADIGLTQMLFTVSILLLDIPMGYIADRFSRKLLNIVGDLGEALVFLLYAFSQNMYMVIFSECMLGLFGAMTNGVDQSFIKYNCNKIDESGELFKKVNSKVYIYRYTMMLLIMIMGGFIAKYNLRATIGLSFIPYFIGGIVALGIEDFADKKEVKHKNPVKDMITTFKDIIKIPKLKTYLCAYILGREVTHSQIWVFTPLMIMVGVPIEIVSLGWVFDQLMRIVGAKIATKMIHKKVSTNFAISILIVVLWITVIVLKLNIFTVWLFALNGITVGLTSGTLQTPLQESAKDEIQTSVMSLASTGARLLYIPLVYIINYLGEIKIQYALIGVVVFFLPISIVEYKRLKAIE